MKNKIIKQVEIEPTIQDVAKIFIYSTSREQAKFFNAIADEVMENWSNQMGDLAIQLQYIINSENLSKEAKDVMNLMAEYFNPESMKRKLNPCPPIQNNIN